MRTTTTTLRASLGVAADRGPFLFGGSLGLGSRRGLCGRRRRGQIRIQSAAANVRSERIAGVKMGDETMPIHLYIVFCFEEIT